MDMPDDVFGAKGKIIVVVPNIIDLFMKSWLNVSIL
jgi:hypothetical protein